MALQTANLDSRVRELEAQNQALLLHMESAQLEIEQLRTVNEQLRTVTSRQADAIEIFESHHGRYFTCFSRLPAELRDRIWQFSTSPRVIDVWSNADFEGRDIYGVVIPRHATYPPAGTWVPRCELRAPVISSVCKESRNLFFREHIILGYATPISGPPISGPPVYFNPLIDTILFAGFWYHDCRHALISFIRYMHNIIEEEKAGDFKKWGIRSMAFDQYMINFLSGGGNIDVEGKNLAALAVFNKFPALEDVVFLAGIYRDRRRRLLASSIVNPRNVEELLIWEGGMRAIGFLKGQADKDCERWEEDEGRYKVTGAKDYTKWLSLRATAAFFEDGGDGFVVDKREGLRVFGPANESSRWSEQEKKFI